MFVAAIDQGQIEERMNASEKKKVWKVKINHYLIKMNCQTSNASNPKQT